MLRLILMGLAVLAVGGSLFVALWTVLPGPQALTWWNDAHKHRQALLNRLFLMLWHRVTMEQTRRDATVMGTGPIQLFSTIFMLIIGAGIILLMLHVPWLISVLAGLSSMIFIPNILIRRRFSRWQRRLVAGLPAFLHHLQILLDLGMPLIGAVKRARMRITGPLGKELDQVIFQLERGLSVGDAFGLMAKDTRRMETMVLAATLTTTAGRRLSGAALEPLLVMLNAVKEREQERVSQAVDQVASTVPILATFGAMITGLYFMLAHALGGLTGVSL
ncbi:MAG: hypothetical protein C7B46_19560 [Sulfobacillus benefaciens]|uniref:Type II secretion system protein GspF domain-containing protein n=1 Tax=Sulfobacillus benefaciens TaxID=453960 RepID=A0A2T2WY23_9FIRM|nr:MAG: hypothetical protein C7B46_19560 [Sulfobacillus benefaciens]